MSKVTWIIFSAIIVLVFGGLIVYSRLSNPSANIGSIDTNSIIAASDDNGQIADHVYGLTDSKVVLVEYGDFQCPSCGGAHPQIKSILEEYKDRITFVFRNFPLTTIHPNARVAAAAVEAAGLQGKYWEMHNLVFESQSEWENLSGTDRTTRFTDYASDLQLDKDKFMTDLSGSQVSKKISFDQAIAKKVGVNATPTFYLNGEQLPDATANAVVQGSTTELKALLDQKLGN